MNKFVINIPNIDREDIYRQHQQIYALFSNEKSCPKFRVDGSTITVLAETTPTASISCKMSKVKEYSKDELLTFQWRGTVTKRQFVKNGKGPTKPILDYPGILAWAQRVSANNGFTITDLQEVSNPYPRYSYKNGNKIPHNTVDFKGVLKVSDAKAFNEAAKNGAGHTKFGAGLLCLQG